MKVSRKKSVAANRSFEHEGIWIEKLRTTGSGYSFLIFLVNLPHRHLDQLHGSLHVGRINRLLRGAISKSAGKPPMHVSAAARLERTDIGHFLHQAGQSSQSAFFKVFSSFENHGAPLLPRKQLPHESNVKF